MEDVWKDINLPSLNNNMNTPVSSPSLKTPTSLHSSINLNSLPEFYFDPLEHKNLQLEQSHHHTSTLSNVEDILSNTIERRNNRIMKNRESATRSRARKQAYIFELKKKVKSLEEENARLKRQNHLCAEAKQQRNGNLYRTSTAPF
ncbi:unnamed protein product [Trifolium pratense]|uniref:Uncharacterized protein n=1 Tax=Trifolium pratense TaxID=57577 RepID=A0ACB0IW56_TRIPR|nr:unnamed protein product [Trifolium pratense]